MKKRIGRRLVSLLLTVVTILTMLPAMTLPALAATSGTLSGLDDKSIGLSFDGKGDDAWSVEGTQIVGQVWPIKDVFLYECDSTLTITNNKATQAKLSFDYQIELNRRLSSCTIGGSKIKAGSGTINQVLNAGESVKVVIYAMPWADATAKITMTNIKLVADTNATVIFKPAENGSYTVNDKPINELCTYTQNAQTAYQVKATPAEGYKFMGWYDETEGKYINTAPTTGLNIDKNRTITARFASKTAALFETGGQPFDDLGDAVTYAQANGQSKITLAADGSISGTYTIPTGITLLIPFDAAGTLYTTTPAFTTTAETQKAYKTLTMAAGSSITVNGGAISVGGKHFTSSNRECCKPTGAYGLIKMQEGSSIMLNNGANLYTWGYITGDGSITANSGANVYEYYQVTDWRGGSQTKDMVNNKQKVFPFTQYYVQNIEAALTLNAGANEYTYISVTARIVGTKSVTIPFVGSNGLFKLGANGQFTKRYIPAQDRMVFTISGEASLNSIVMSLASIATFDSQDYVLPINNNVDIVITSGTTTIEKDAALLPGVTVLIAKDAELKVASAASLYVYDDAEWSQNYVWGSNSFGSSGICPVSYSPSGKGSRGIADAKVDVNGVLTVAGAVYTTATGANITSSEGTGKFAQVGAPGTSNKTYQFNQNSKEYIGVDITAAKLKNADGKYTGTAGSSAGATFTYCTCTTCGGGKWTNTNDLQVAAIINNGTQGDTYSTLEAAVNAYSPDSNAAPTNYIKLLHNTTEKPINVNSKSLRLDLNGRTVTGNFNMNGNTLYGMDSSSKEYAAPSGKIVGTVTGTVAPTYQTPTVKEEYDRYVAISGLEADGKTANLSFHHFNISVTGYRFELATGDTPQCALFFIGKFQGDDAAKKYLKSLGFTLTDIDGKTTNPRYEIPAGTKIPPMPSEGVASESEVVLSDDGAYFFEAYLMRDIDKENYRKQFSAIAQATFQNDKTQNSETKKWSFQEALTKPEGLTGLTPEQKTILNNFLDGLDTPNQTE